MLDLSNIYSTARSVYHGGWCTLYIVGFQYYCFDNNNRIEYYCVPSGVTEGKFRKRTSMIRYRNDGVPFFIANKHRVLLDNVLPFEGFAGG